MIDYIKTFYQAMKLGVYYNQVASQSKPDSIRTEIVTLMASR